MYILYQFLTAFKASSINQSSAMTINNNANELTMTADKNVQMMMTLNNSIELTTKKLEETMLKTDKIMKQMMTASNSKTTTTEELQEMLMTINNSISASQKKLSKVLNEANSIFNDTLSDLSIQSEQNCFCIFF